MKWQNYRNGEQTSGCKELKGGRWEQEGSGCGQKKATGGILVAVGMFCILTVSMSVSWLRLHYTFTSCYPWGKLDEGYRGSLYVIYYNCICIYSYLKIKSLILKDWINYLTIWEKLSYFSICFLTSKLIPESRVKCNSSS